MADDNLEMVATTEKPVKAVSAKTQTVTKKNPTTDLLFEATVETRMLPMLAAAGVRAGYRKDNVPEEWTSEEIQEAAKVALTGVLTKYVKEMHRPRLDPE